MEHHGHGHCGGGTRDTPRRLHARTGFSICYFCVDDGTDFTDAWRAVKGRFKALHRFCGGLASVFPETSQVESDFSVLKDEKDIFSAAITDLSLESVLRSKQFDMLSVL